MEPVSGQQGLQLKLQGILSKINKEHLRSRVTDWQKKIVATASSRFSFESTTQVSSSGVVAEEVDGIGSVNISQNEETQAAEVAAGSQTHVTPEGEETGVPRPDEFKEEIIMDQAETLLDVKLLTPIEEHPRNKSPVQQWVDSLTDEHERDEDMPPIVEADQNDAEVESFTLGAEAPGVVCPRPYPFVQVTAHCGGSDTGSHCSSMESLLEARKPDPEEMLLELGFGGCEEPDIISRIPKRFLRPSTMKGVHIDEFIKHQQLMVHQFQSGFSGYRGLTGPSHAMPSGIVGKIMGRLLEAEVERQNQEAYHRAQHQQAMFMNGTVQHCQASQTQGGYSPKLARLAHSLMVKMKSSKNEMSVLSPENRNWYESQGDKSPEPAGKRLIIGHRSYTFAKDGDLVEDFKDGGSDKSPRISPKPGNFEEAETEKSDRAYPPSTHNGHHVSSSEDSSARTDSRSRVLFEVSEEDENCASSKTDVSESSKSVPSSETVQDDSWLSSLAGIDENGLETSATKLFRDGLPSGREARRGSFPEVRHSADRRRASLLESWVLAEIGSSQNEERCSSCGSRKTSATEVAPPSKSTCDLVEIGTDPYLPPEYEEVDSMAGIVSAAKDSEKPKEEYASNNEFPLRPISEDNCAAPAAEGPSLAMELNHLAEPGLAESDPSWSPPADQIVVAKDFCSCDDLAEETSASGSSTISKNSPIREDEDEAEIEYNNLLLLTSQLQDGVAAAEVGSREEFMAYNSAQRKHVQLAMIEKALQLYHKRLKELDLRGHLRDLLAGQLLRVNDLLDSVSSPSALTIVMKQTTSLLRYQEALRQELEMHEGRDGKISKS